MCSTPAPDCQRRYLILTAMLTNTNIDFTRLDLIGDLKLISNTPASNRTTNLSDSRQTRRALSIDSVDGSGVRDTSKELGHTGNICTTSRRQDISDSNVSVPLVIAIRMPYGNLLNLCRVNLASFQSFGKDCS
jgi:hypothetical protein